MDKSKEGNTSSSILAAKIKEIANKIRQNPPEIIDQGNQETVESEGEDMEIISQPQTSTEPQVEKHGTKSAKIHDGYLSLTSALNLGSQITIKGHETKIDMKPRNPLKFLSDEESNSPKVADVYVSSAKNKTELDSSPLQVCKTSSSSDDELDTWLKTKLKRYVQEGRSKTEKRVNFFVEKDSPESKNKGTRCVPNSARCYNPTSFYTTGNKAEITQAKDVPVPKGAIVKVVRGNAVKKYAKIQAVKEALRKISEDRKKLMELPIQFERLLERSTADDLSELANY